MIIYDVSLHAVPSFLNQANRLSALLRSKRAAQISLLPLPSLPCMMILYLFWRHAVLAEDAS